MVECLKQAGTSHNSNDLLKICEKIGASLNFLSLHPSFWSSFLAVVLHPARRHGTPFPSGWRIFYKPRPPTLGPSLAYTERVEILAHSTEKLSLDWSDEPRKSQSSKLDERFLSGSGSRPDEEKAAFLP